MMSKLLNLIFSIQNIMEENQYMSISQASELWGLSTRRIAVLCKETRIPGTIRIGNQWAIPTNANKPEDARYKKDKKTPTSHTKRLRVKKDITEIYDALTDEDIEISKKRAMCIFSCLVVYECLDQKSTYEEVYEKIAQLFHIESVPKLPLNDCPNVSAYARDENVVAWAYQYLNKRVDTTGISETQFFTEDYMVTRLILDSDLSKTSLVLDPACGGGNFLTSSLDSIIKRIETEEERIVDLDDVKEVLDKIKGYDIDPVSAVIADINIRIKVATLLSNRNTAITLDEWWSVSPKIYCPEHSTIGGFLDVTNNNQTIRKISDDSKINLNELPQNVTNILTNPPFKTIKGMDESLKTYLKTYFPSSSCDLCNAFISAMSHVLSDKSTIGMVSQNSWLFLKTFDQFRWEVLEKCDIKRIINLGSGAFDDISGEKTSVSLITISLKTADKNVTIMDLSHLNKKEKREAIFNKVNERIVPFESLINSFGTIRLNQSFIERLEKSMPRYGEFAVPMQGTSTGKSSEVVDWFWNHIGDDNWKAVSKGGGYSRWCGLNNHSIFWINSGENIRNVPGSALRNVSQFGKTQLCFSDTGTSGLSVRLMGPNEIFIASGPGIRIEHGQMFAHLAFLNSRYASYYLKQTNPKLTIAAGYIARIPVTEEILDSEILSKIGQEIVDLKNKYLSKRPTNREFSWTCPHSDLDALAKEMFLDDLKNENKRLDLYSKSNCVIESLMGITAKESEEMSSALNKNRPVCFNTAEYKMIDITLSKITNMSCELQKSKTTKTALGSDGPLEYTIELLQIDKEDAINEVVLNIDDMEQMLAKYKQLILNNMVMALMGYPFITSSSLPLNEVKNELTEAGSTFDFSSWIRNRFNEIHTQIMKGNPVWRYCPDSDRIVSIAGVTNV